jgi:OOP family OmpA-OmpF porin
LDNEPFTPKESPISRDGVALDSDRDGVPDIFDQEPNSEEDALVDAKGIDISYADFAEEVELANIYFELNSSEIASYYYPDLFKVAKFLQDNPGARILAEGHTDQVGNENYNQKLSVLRVNKTVDFLVKNYGIDIGRIEVKAFGQKEPLVPDLPGKYSKETEAGHYMNRRVTFRVIE